MQYRAVFPIGRRPGAQHAGDHTRPPCGRGGAALTAAQIRCGLGGGCRRRRGHDHSVSGRGPRCRSGHTAIMSRGRAANARAHGAPQRMAQLRGRSRSRTDVRRASPANRFAGGSLTTRAFDHCAPGWNRTSATRRRRTVLFPLSYEGMSARPWCRPRSARSRWGYSPLDVPPSTTRLG